MALGGGTFTTTDKMLAGAYINSVSAARSLSLIGDNGVVAIALEHDYGNTGEVMTLTPSEFREDSLSYLGYSLFDDKLKGLRELFENSKRVHIYVLNNTTKASNDLATAKKGGTRGNEIVIKVQNNLDNPEKKDVITMIDFMEVDKQTVTKASELQPNAFVTFKDTELTEKAGEKLKGGSDGNVTNGDHQKFLSLIETMSFNSVACMATTKEVQKLYIAYTKRMRDDIGLKFATILCEASDLGGDSQIYDYEGVVIVKNKVKGESTKGNELVPYTAAIYANAQLGRSNLNRQYTGEYEVITDYTQLQLKDMIKAGRFVYHRVGDTVRVLEDVNGLVTFTDAKGSEFKDNQVVRVLDALAISDARVFNEVYLGKVNIDTAGKESYRNKIIDVREEFLKRGALKDYDKDSIQVVEIKSDEVRGAVKVDSSVTPAECFRQLYLTNYVRR
ncbi:MAG: phage tail sheath subtilisin-like domain-containing protein [Peptostreptococcus sp.]|uniref:phage tail sheath subtilisin-like domain-containing protein n=1 Tax=Peptostreptococcus TaxID=1257 RepID=UPI00242EB42B|nr:MULTISPECIES: phage tail sheath subtilisin-like domain-containing protein [Peptostreptococcus]MDU5681012.1 phage tail sheath subtilisin-like domain-containing protein [Peptostreptococcus sp.]MDU5737931.1 phage tail sheath subtilisin-like domain-containing protein [Peptostreptococcus sp.]